jgi:hypothetical protein
LEEFRYSKGKAMDFTEEMTDEIAARLRSIVANYKKNQKKFPETKVNLEIYDADKNTILTYSLDEVPDASIILEELEFPEKVKLDYSMTIFEIFNASSCSFELLIVDL